MSSKRSRVHPRYKTKNRVKNGPDYDRALVARGDLTVWITPKALEAWRPARSEAGRRAETRIACDILNRMTGIGRPESVAISA